MSPMLRKDLEYVLPKLSAEDRVDARTLLAAIERLIPERKGAYSLGEIEGAIRELEREKAK